MLIFKNKAFRTFSFLLLVLFSFGSCISNKKYNLLQKSSKNDSDSSYIEFNRSIYKIRVNDILRIVVKSRDEEITRDFNLGAGGSNAASNNLIGQLYLEGYSVDTSGLIEVPYLGFVKAEGLSLDELRNDIIIKLDKYVKTDNIFVSVKLAGINFSVLGEVGSPGNFNIYKNQVNIFEAISYANNFSLMADRKSVTIVRQQKDGSQIISIDLTDRNIIASQHYFIQPNDLIYIRALKQRELGTGTTGFGTILNTITTLSSLILIFRLIKG